MLRGEGVSRAGCKESAVYREAQAGGIALREPSACQFACPAVRMLLSTGSIMKLCIFIGVNAGGYAGWVLGEPFGMMAAFLVSSVGSLLGVVVGWKIARHYLA
jgi:hypothetical protein